jgi:hypothetical protein
MDSEPFLESCRHDNERELQGATYLPSMAEIAVLKRQIRDEKKAKDPPDGCPQAVRSYREPRIFTANHNRQRRKHPSS